MSRKQLFITLAAIFLTQIFLAQGATLTADGTGIVARTNIVGVSLGLLLAGVVLTYHQKPFVEANGKVVQLRLRACASLIDVWIAMTVLTSLGAFLMLVYVWLATGQFRWSIRVPTPSGPEIAVASALVAAIFVGMVGYWGFHWKRGRQTPGQYVLGYRVQPEPGAEINVLSLLFKGAVGLIYWPVTLFVAAGRPDRKLWWQGGSSKVEAVLAARQ